MEESQVDSRRPRAAADVRRPTTATTPQQRVISMGVPRRAAALCALVTLGAWFTWQQRSCLPLPAYTPLISRPARGGECSMHSCFDYSRCPLTGGFSVYFYDLHKFERLGGIRVNEFLKTSFLQVFRSSPHITTDPQTACIYIVLIGESNSTEESDSFVDESNELTINATALRELRYWGEEGRNHVLVSMARSAVVGDTGAALLVQSRFARRPRPGFDVLVPPVLGGAGDVWQDCEPMAPARRRYLLTFQGKQTDGGVGEGEGALRALEVAATGRDVRLQWRCKPAEGRLPPSGEWALCGSERARRSVLAASTFALLPPGPQLQRLLEALRAGAIPVLLYTQPPLLPYAEVVDWSRAVLVVPSERAGEVPLLLRAMSDADVLRMRRQGRMFWERYMSTVQAIADSLLSVLRTRLLFPPPLAPVVLASPAFGSSFTPPHAPLPDPKNASSEETFEPIEPSFPSPAYARNFSLAFVDKYAMWNEWMDPFAMFPQLPWDPAVTSEARFVGPRAPYRPLEAAGGAPGERLRAALGGDYPREYFTIVILSYERPTSLATTLTQLTYLPYLRKVVVVWNGESEPAKMAPWPHSGAPVVVVRGHGNSLNNRFLPYHVVDTESVLCLDDDTHLQRDEIIFAFRVWRQHRDQIVGFPARAHTWNNHTCGFLYHAATSCEASMVLTGAAFIHRYYMFAYWRVLPATIRRYVDEHLNCEDIAMNFLVAHITRKPPIKVTGRTTFGAPSSGATLSSRKAHYERRSQCIQFFSKVMGYTPLMLTQYRADSMLYNMHLSPQTMCFINV